MKEMLETILLISEDTRAKRLSDNMYRINRLIDGPEEVVVMHGNGWKIVQRRDAHLWVVRRGVSQDVRLAEVIKGEEDAV